MFGQDTPFAQNPQSVIELLWFFGSLVRHPLAARRDSLPICRGARGAL